MATFKLSRRSFCASCVGIAMFGGAENATADQIVLPEGDTRSPIMARYFPDRVHEFVWRNWNAVGPAKLASVLGASVADVTNIAKSMGLPPAIPVPIDMKERGYVTILHRNWHLLPYEQLLQLVEMTPERLDFALREDDFLWLKLGGLKPKCEPLRYQPPDEAGRRRAAEIRRIVETDFGEEIYRSGEPRFEFFRKLSTLPSTGTSQSVPAQAAPLRIVYPYGIAYGEPLLDPKLNTYSEGLLERLATTGANGIWLQAVLRNLAPGGKTFPEFGNGSDTRLASLRTLVDRARRHGIGVYFYLNEPRAMPEAFFKTRPELAGVHEDGFATLCTSQPVVRKWIADALAYVFSNVPGLAGISTITASENLTNCASHYHADQCPRCRTRTDTEIITELVATMEEGIHRANPGANVIVSDWGWRRHGDSVDIIQRLPKNVWFLSVSEWAKPIERGGIKNKVNEYSISAVGPGPRAARHWTAARECGLKTVAEVQFNNTCECASLSYLPVMDLIAEHIHNLEPFKLDGMFIGWTQGGYPSPNFEIARQMTLSQDPTSESVLDGLARDRYGSEGAPRARKAWSLMSEAFRQYPFDIDVVYTAPVQIGPANPLYSFCTGYRATMWGFPYDDLEGWRGPYPPEVFAQQFDRVADAWQPGAEDLKAAVEMAPENRREAVKGDLRFAQAAGIIFKSTANQARFILAREVLAKPLWDSLNGQPAEVRQQQLAELKRCLKSEIELARQLFVIAHEDSRIGYEPTCQYFFLPLDLVEKVINCRWLLAQYDDPGFN